MSPLQAADVILTSRARTLIGSNIFDEAISLIHDNINKYSPSARAYHALGLVYFHKNAEDEAIEYFNKALVPPIKSPNKVPNKVPQ